MVYWNMFEADKKTDSLPCSFHEDKFFSIYDWYGRSLVMQPPHTRDLLSVGDIDYSTTMEANKNAEEEEEQFHNEDNEDVPPTPFTANSEDNNVSTNVNKRWP